MKGVKVTDYAAFEDGKNYIACGGEPFDATARKEYMYICDCMSICMYECVDENSWYQ